MARSRVLRNAYCCFVLLMACTSTVFAAHRVVDLSVDYKTVNFAGKSIQALAINQQIPAPTLHFKQGDHVTIRVTNHLREGTTLHWHGIILPWQMDGVEHVTQQPIAPGETFSYQFTLKQSGTYWYHAHSGFQEQRGLYGAFVIDPVNAPSYHYTKDFPVLLSDWSNTHPDQIYANLKKDGDYYSPRFPLQASLARFIRDYRKANPAQKKALVENYKMMQQMRMSIYDLSDVAYDAFLMNGHTTTNPWVEKVKVGDVVRLRLIGAGANTFFRFKIPNTRLHVVHVQGNDVVPYFVDSLTIAPGETYDVLVHIQKKEPYILYAESSDKVGKIYGALITEPNQFVDYKAIQPFPEPEPAMAMGGMSMGDMSMPMTHSHMGSGMSEMSGMKGMSDTKTMDSQMGSNMSGMSEMSDMKEMSQAVPTTKYANLKSPVRTNDPGKLPDEIIRIDLYGYMGRYIWFLNGLPEYKAKPILIQPGKRYRIIFSNTSMMSHPMHLHGHWLILRNGHGAYDPLLHTIDVAPGATISVDFDADAGDGAWYFHCHNLYHMMAGMARVFYYPNTQLPTPGYQHTDVHPSIGTAHPAGIFRATFLDVGQDISENVQRVSFRTLIGPDYHKLQLTMEDAEIRDGKVENADVDIFYWHLISEFWAIKGGANYVYRPAAYWQPGIGIEGLAPYFIDTNLRAYWHAGSAKLDVQLSRDSQITNNFFIRTGIRSILATKTVVEDEVGSGLNELRFIVRPYYRLTTGVSLFMEYEHSQAYGSLRNLRSDAGEATTENTLTLGVAFLF